MGDHTVTVDRSKTPAKLHFAPRFNVACAFVDRHLSQGRRAKTAIRTIHGDVSYAELAANVNRVASALTQLGMTPGERLLMVIKDCPEFFYVFWGAIKAGVIPVPANTMLRADTFAFMIDDSQAATLIFSPEYGAELEAAVARSGHVPRHVFATCGKADSLVELIERAATGFEPVPTTAEDDCFWLYSSGSTGRPKAAIHRHRDMVVTSQYYGVDTLGVCEDDIVYSEAKLFFAYGLGNNMSMPLWVGATAVLNEGRPGAATSFPIIERFRPTLYFGVPTLYASHLQAFATAKPDFSSVRYCVSAGEALPAEILKRWREATGLSILDGIGSTEALHIFICNRPDDIRPGSSGRAVAGYQARIVDERGEDVAVGENGRLFISGDSVAREYWNNPAKTAETMVNGWLDTGDTYRCDADGYYHYCGRSDDMLKVGGIWCSPFDIESRLIEHPSVLEAAVVGRPDADGLIKPAAFLVLKTGVIGNDAFTAELVQFCKDRLAPYQYPRWFNFLNELPKTATGKIQRFQLRLRQSAPDVRSSSEGLSTSTGGNR